MTSFNVFRALLLRWSTVLGWTFCCLHIERMVMTCLASWPVHSFSRMQFMSHNLLRHWWHQLEHERSMHKNDMQGSQRMCQRHASLHIQCTVFQESNSCHTICWDIDDTNQSNPCTRMTCKVRNGCVNEMTMKQCFLLRKNLEKHHWWAHACCLTKKMLFLKHHIGSMWSGCLCAHFASQCWCGWTMHCMSTKSVIPLNVSITSVDLSHHLLKMAVLEWQVTFPGDLILVWKTVSFVRSIAQNKHERMG